MIKNNSKIIITALASWGILLTGSGITMQLMTKPVTKDINKTSLTVLQRKVEKAKSNEIKLKDMTLEINQPLSVNVRDYLTNPDDIENSIIKKLRLDTSMINTNQAGSYTYTITFNKKKYNGTFIINEKPLPAIENMTLKTLSLKVGSTLSTDIKTYIVETLPEEALPNVKLNLSNVNTSVTGNYQYTVTYNGKLYTGTITIYEPQEIKTKTEKKEEDTNTPPTTPEISPTPTPTETPTPTPATPAN